jgi:short-subunit dehydrogenase
VPKLTSFHGLTALVTGASSGIGRALALRLAREGARVALVARRADRLQELAEEITSAGGEAFVLPCDVSERAQVYAAADRALERFGSIDLLVNNAGYGHHRRFLDWDIEDMEHVMRVNYVGTLYWTKALLPQMVERKRGWIVFMASLAGRVGVPEESAYVASKFALVGLSEALSIELEDDGVHVLTVCPAIVRTGFFDDEALANMPPVSKRTMLEPEVLVDGVIKALALGKHQITVPGRLAVAYLVKAVAPGFMRRNVKRSTIEAMAKEQRRTGA